MGAEKNFENRVKKYLEVNGIYPLGSSRKSTLRPIGYYEKRFGGGNYTKAGLPDLHIVINGKSIEVELKAERGKPSSLQLFTINQINNSGGIGLVLYPKDFNRFKELIENEIQSLKS